MSKLFRPELFVLGDLAICYEERQVSVAEREVRLMATEFEFLHILSVNAGRVMTYDALIRQIWGGEERGKAGRVFRGRARNGKH